ncbi:MarR family winged helix-turn-helix transcriptional regulator [Nonomuraea angiospora]|uniref:DNA-binding MarR family transcriptional regulator n=1 Tax=Nonomuraea angiospora TaxID=46172 RepID=A0ABR9M667_9ACTN|nr:MarR family transcriptional regulator [Nonomuraea angiospora]MBE1588411.1 DNA-binding MarR family transcriptional regulator [Nonomuraea angiospora]MDX3100097.1 MarR family transcriptional regulator [Nonomuraea angiospora]
MTRWLNDDEQRAWRAFGLASRLLTDRLERDLLAGAGMPPTYYELLVLLSEAPERTMRMSELAHWTNSKPSRISHAVNKLEEKGWVRREHCVDDRRGWLAVLTDDGLAALRATAPRHVASVREHLIDLLTPEQLRQLEDISQVLLDHLVEPGGAQ